MLKKRKLFAMNGLAIKKFEHNEDRVNFLFEKINNLPSSRIYFDNNDYVCIARYAITSAITHVTFLKHYDKNAYSKYILAKYGENKSPDDVNSSIENYFMAVGVSDLSEFSAGDFIACLAKMYRFDYFKNINELDILFGVKKNNSYAIKIETKDDEKDLRFFSKEIFSLPTVIKKSKEEKKIYLTTSHFYLHGVLSLSEFIGDGNRDLPKTIDWIYVYREFDSIKIYVKNHGESGYPSFSYSLINIGDPFNIEDYLPYKQEVDIDNAIADNAASMVDGEIKPTRRFVLKVSESSIRKHDYILYEDFVKDEVTYLENPQDQNYEIRQIIFSSEGSIKGETRIINGFDSLENLVRFFLETAIIILNSTTPDADGELINSVFDGNLDVDYWYELGLSKGAISEDAE